MLNRHVLVLAARYGERTQGRWLGRTNRGLVSIGTLAVIFFDKHGFLDVSRIENAFVVEASMLLRESLFLVQLQVLLKVLTWCARNAHD